MDDGTSRKGDLFSKEFHLSEGILDFDEVHDSLDSSALESTLLSTILLIS